jgi:peptidoglycan/xylan/chitin deacetylase (PgdA/CDA1 family)
MDCCIALKVDVDTLHGTLEGAPRLAAVLARLGCNATFLFSVGPDHTGRAVRRVLQPGFLSKIRRTSVARHYGIRTLMYGTLLPGPHIGRLAREQMRAVARAGFETGLHAYDHVRWQDCVASRDRDWARRELARGIDAFADALDCLPTVHGAAGWRISSYVPELERELGIRVASDTRGREPFLPVIGGRTIDVPQLPTTLPTFDELLGRRGLEPADPVACLLGLTRSNPRDHVYTLHAEIEGGPCLGQLEALLEGWRSQGYRFTSLGELASRAMGAGLPSCAIADASVQGRAGCVATQSLRARTRVRIPRSSCSAYRI